MGVLEITISKRSLPEGKKGTIEIQHESSVSPSGFSPPWE